MPNHRFYSTCSGEDWQKQHMRCLVRVSFRCQAPGCDEEDLRLIEVHRITLGIRAGWHDLSNLVTLCHAHHIDEHHHMLYQHAAAEQVVDELGLPTR